MPTDDFQKSRVQYKDATQEVKQWLRRTTRPEFGSAFDSAGTRPSLIEQTKKVTEIKPPVDIPVDIFDALTNAINGRKKCALSCRSNLNRYLDITRFHAWQESNEKHTQFVTLLEEIRTILAHHASQTRLARKVGKASKTAVGTGKSTDHDDGPKVELSLSELQSLFGKLTFGELQRPQKQRSECVDDKSRWPQPLPPVAPDSARVPCAEEDENGEAACIRFFEDCYSTLR